MNTDVEEINLASILENYVPTADEMAWDHAMDISGSIYTRLKELGMSQKDLADKLEVSPGRVSQIIKGDPGMTLRSLAKLEVALGIDLGDGFRYGLEPRAPHTAASTLNIGERAETPAHPKLNTKSSNFVLYKGGLAA